jgi:ABC-type glycerol-3-phosphate transport system substrate-binding protein
MKKTLATLLVAGALAAAGLSATAAISASGENSGKGSVEAVNWWPNSTKK